MKSTRKCPGKILLTRRFLQSTFSQFIEIIIVLFVFSLLSGGFVRRRRRESNAQGLGRARRKQTHLVQQQHGVQRRRPLLGTVNNKKNRVVTFFYSINDI